MDPINFQKADLRVITTLKIPAHSGLPVRLGTTIGKNQKPMPHGIQVVLTIASIEFPYLQAR
jgi:hypothetical protein